MLILFSVPSWHLNSTQIFIPPVTCCAFIPPRYIKAHQGSVSRFFMPLLHRLYTLSVHSGTFFLQYPATAEWWLFIGCFTQTVLSFDDRNLSSTYTVSFTAFSKCIIWRHSATNYQACGCTTGCLPIPEFKMSTHYLHPNYIHVLCVPSQTQLDTLNSGQISHTSPHGDWSHLGLSGMSRSVHIQYRPDWQHMHRRFYGHFGFLPFSSLECINSSYCGKIQNIDVT